MNYSILEHFSSGGVLLTGGSGYVGALVLEKLLRCTNVSSVFVMLRAKKGEDVQARLSKMLNSSPVMHLLRDNPVLSKVKAVAGDMKAPNLGISSEDLALLRATVHTVIHCAADIRLEVGIQELLLTNYEGTRHLLELSETFDELKAFVHVSSAYTNMNATPGSLVTESIYPLSYGDQPVVDSELVQELLSMPAHNANLRAEGLLAQWNFPNNYTLSKHLAEYMVADYQQHANLPVAIVRPTLISSCARDPYPGFTGNYAGHVGATLAFMVGLFDSPAASNYKASNVWDVIPSDVVANVILAAAAALGAGLAASCHVSPTRVTTPQLAHLQPVTAAAGALAVEPAQQGGKAGGLEEGSKAGQGEQQGSAGPLLIVHCGSSTTYPLTIMESWNWGVEVYGAWQMPPNLVWGKCAGPMLSTYEPDPRKAAQHMTVTSWKIWLASKLLGAFKMSAAARKLKVGFESFKIINQPKTDVNLRFSTSNMQRLAALLRPSEQDDFLLLWRPKPTSRPRFTAGGAAADSTPGRAWPRSSSLGGTCSPGPQAEESKSLTGPHSKSGGQALLDSTPNPATGDTRSSIDFLIKAGSTPEVTTTNGNSSSGGSSSQGTSRAATPTREEQEEGAAAVAAVPAVPAVRHGAMLSPEGAAAVARMRDIPVEWRSFHINLGAYLYCSMFKMPVPAPELPISKPEVSAWLNIRPEDSTIRHQFVLYK